MILVFVIAVAYQSDMVGPVYQKRKSAKKRFRVPTWRQR